MPAKRPHCARALRQREAEYGGWTKMAEIIVTHAADAAQRARRVAEKLSSLGYVVRQDLDAEANLGPHGRRKLAAAIDQAGVVLVLWSKDAQAAPALIEAASRAKAKGK